ncbi:MAG: BatD family protein [Legionellaceae bacterium]|nr:BatD family protein [Legionellaceae bacterium]
MRAKSGYMVTIRHSRAGSRAVALLALCVWMLLVPLWAKPSVQVDPADIVQGKAFRLILRDDSHHQGVPDLTPLERDFSIHGTEQSASVTVINNQIQSETSWIIYLSTQKSGQLTIPALTIDGEQTDPLVIHVQKSQTAVPASPAPTTAPAVSPPKPGLPQNSKEDVLLQVEVDLKKPYLNQQVIYTVRLFNARRLVDVEFQAPQAQDALMFPLGDSRRYQLTEQGKHYAVEEQHFALFPLKSGSLTVTPPQFSALIYDGFPQRIRPQADSIQLQVQPVPAGSTVARWLPAKAVKLEEEYDTDSKTLEEGDTLTREITLKALGMTAELLPEYPFASTADFNVYHDKPVPKNYLQAGEVLGTLTLKVTYVFNTAGTIHIPAFSVPWFNTQNHQWEEAKLPARTLQIKPATAAAAPISSDMTAKPAAGGITARLPAAEAGKQSERLWLLRSGWFWGGGLVVGLLLAAMLLWRRYSGRLPLLATRRELEQGLRRACKKNEARQAADYFLRWAQMHWPQAHPLNVTQAAALSGDQALIQQSTLLSQALYEPRRPHWLGHDFWAAFQHYCAKKARPRASRASALPPIHPD